MSTKVNGVDIGLCEGRHDMPVDDYIFKGKVDPQNFSKLKRIAVAFVQSLPNDCVYINVYVTGLTSAMLSLVWACEQYGKGLVAYHYDKHTKDYIPQLVLRSNILEAV